MHLRRQVGRQLHQLVPHQPNEVGKAPIGRLFPKGINDATTNTAKLDTALRAMPTANVGVEVQSAGWFVVDPDSPETEAAALSDGLDGAVIRESRTGPMSSSGLLTARSST